MRIVVCFVFAALVLTAQAPTDRDRKLERAMGERLLESIEAATPRIPDAEVERYISGIVAKVAAACAPDLAIETRVMVSPSFTAHAIPGGFLLFNTGLIQRADNEAELAGVAAQLVSYLQAGSYIRRRTNASGVPLVYTGGWSGYTYGVTHENNGPIGFRKQLAQDTAKADTAAVQCLSKSGYDPEQFLTNLRKLEAIESEGKLTTPVGELLPASKRAADVAVALRGLAASPDSVLDRAAFAEIRTRAQSATQTATASRKTTPPSLRNRVPKSQIM